MSKSKIFFKDYVYGIVIGIISGFLISNTILSSKQKSRLFPCINNLSLQMLINRKSVYSVNIQSRSKLLLVCVLTTRQHLKTRALAIFRTWKPEVMGDVIFFIGGVNDYTGPLPVIRLKNIIDDEYPPQRKSFAMLKYVSSNYGNRYHWFMRVDDDMFLYGQKMKDMLHHVNEHKMLYIGHPGIGALNEVGRIGLHGADPYCMGGPGIVFSAVLLNSMAPGLNVCLNHTVTNHEDSELGRCIYKQCGVTCTRSREFKSLFFQNYEDSSGEWVESMTSSNHLTLHPIKNSSYIYKIYISDKSEAIWRLTNKIESLRNDIASISTLINIGDTVSLRVRVENGNNLLNFLNSSISWSCDCKYISYSLYSRDLTEPFESEGKYISFMKARRKLVDYLKLTSQNLQLSLLSYRRLLPNQGLQTMLVTKNMNNTIRSFLVVHKFDQLYFKEGGIYDNTSVIV